MTLELSDLELDALREAVRLQLGALIDELTHTEDRTYRAGLRQTLERLEAVQRRLEALAAHGRAA